MNFIAFQSVLAWVTAVLYNSSRYLELENVWLEESEWQEIISLQEFILIGEHSYDEYVTPEVAPNLTTAGTWAHESITEAFGIGLIPEALQNYYTANITCAEFAYLAVTLYELITGAEIAITREIAFNDTNDINVHKAAYINVVQCVGNNNFAPDTVLTREQAAVMLSRLAYTIGQPLTEQAPTFADNEQTSL